MEQIGTLQAIHLCSRYQKMSQRERAALQKERLKRLVCCAKKESPFFSRLYVDVPENFSLDDLPPTDKPTMMAHWDEWITDRSVTLAQVQAFMADPDNIGRKLLGQYMVVTTSGSTGNPLVMLYDKTMNNVLGGISALRSYARKEDMRAFIRRGGKSMGIYADSGFYLGNSTIRAKLLKMPWKKRQIGLSSALYPIGKIVDQLNDFQPVMLGGYPSNLELLIEEQNSGRLYISPSIVMTGGEYLSDSLRKRLSECFGCYVQTSYACTEGGTVACECRKQHLHINDDWLIVEPVDRYGRPVPEGRLADKILLTNLYNFIQPVIRYEVTDRVILHREPCACGNPSPWLEIEGRNDDVITLTAGEKTIRIPPLALYAELKEVHELRRFQLLVSSGNRIKLRLEPAAGVSRDAAFLSASTALRSRIELYGIDAVDIALSDELPQSNPVSGKFKHIINEKESKQ